MIEKLLYDDRFCEMLYMAGPKAIQSELERVHRYSEACEGNIIKRLNNLESLFFKVLRHFEYEKTKQKEEEK